MPALSQCPEAWEEDAVLPQPAVEPTTAGSGELDPEPPDEPQPAPAEPPAI